METARGSLWLKTDALNGDSFRCCKNSLTAKLLACHKHATPTRCILTTVSLRLPTRRRWNRSLWRRDRERERENYKPTAFDVIFFFLLLGGRIKLPSLVRSLAHSLSQTVLHTVTRFESQKADTSQARRSLNGKIMLFKLRPWQRAHISTCKKSGREVLGGRREVGDGAIINTANPLMESDTFFILFPFKQLQMH